MTGLTGCLGVASRLTAEGTRNVVLEEVGYVVLEEVGYVRREGPPRIVEEIGPSRLNRYPDN